MPPPPTNPCYVCVNVVIQPPNPLVGTLFTFDKGNCLALTSHIASVLNGAAATNGADLITPFSNAGCTGRYRPDRGIYPTAKVCGTFATEYDGTLLQDEINDLLYEFIQFLIGPSGCTSDLAGYDFSASAYSTGDVNCLSGEASFSCTISVNPPAPLEPTPRPSPEPSPAPTPSPEIVTTHDCITNSAVAPFSLSHVTTSSDSGLTRICTTIQAQSCDPSKFCCRPNQRNYNKVEIPINVDCRSSVKGLSVGGEVIAVTFGTYPDPSILTVKFTELATQHFADTGIAGNELCVLVSEDNGCATPEALCRYGSCQANIFSIDNKCCPITFINGA